MAKHGQIPWRISISSQNLDHGHHTTSHVSVDETTLGSSECGMGGWGDHSTQVFHPLVAYCCPCCFVLSQEAGMWSKTLTYGLPSLIRQCKNYYQVTSVTFCVLFICILLFGPAPLLPSPFPGFLLFLLLLNVSEASHFGLHT